MAASLPHSGRRFDGCPFIGTQRAPGRRLLPHGADITEASLTKYCFVECQHRRIAGVRVATALSAPAGEGDGQVGGVGGRVFELGPTRAGKRFALPLGGLGGRPGEWEAHLVGPLEEVVASSRSATLRHGPSQWTSPGRRPDHQGVQRA